MEKTIGQPDVDRIIAYEQGDLDDAATLQLFSELVASGIAWQLQGHYGRTAAAFIQNGFLSKDGEILKRPSES